MLPVLARSQTHIVLPVDISRVRSLGMASATNAVEDDLGALAFNPATYNLYQNLKRFRLTLFLSPISPGVLLQQPEEYFGERRRNGDKALAALLSLIRGVNVSVNSLDFGILLSEPRIRPLDEYASEGGAHLRGVFNNHYDSITARFRLAQQLSIGASVQLMFYPDSAGDRRQALGTSYGVYLIPQDGFQVGISYFSFPEKVRGYRNVLEGIYSDAINLGISYAAPWRFNVSLDLRNIAVGQGGPREMYFLGLEQELFAQVALRGGVQYRIEADTFAYSAGIGLLNMNNFLHSRQPFMHPNFALNYAVIFQRQAGQTRFIHAFQLLIRL